MLVRLKFPLLSLSFCGALQIIRLYFEWNFLVIGDTYVCVCAVPTTKWPSHLVSCVPSNVRFYLLVRPARYEKRLNRFELEFDFDFIEYARPITYLAQPQNSFSLRLLHSNTIPFFLIPASESFYFFIFPSFISDQMVVPLSRGRSPCAALTFLLQSSPRTCFYARAAVKESAKEGEEKMDFIIRSIIKAV